MSNLARASILVFATHAALASAARSRTNLDAGWRFALNDGLGPVKCNSTAFPIDLTDKACQGLNNLAYISSPDDCRNACCGDSKCNVWQWAPNQATGCWTGAIKDTASCPSSKGFKSQGRPYPTPSPSPSPSSRRCTEPQCQVDFDDSAWQSVSAPHDFVVNGTYSETADKDHGYLPYAKGWYRLNFSLPESARGQAVWLDFDGVYRDSRTWLNGWFLGAHASGYTPFRYAIGTGSTLLNASNLRFGSDGDNVLVVHADATNPDSWWYDGGGIYRSVWLTVADPLHVAPWGVYAPATVRTGTIRQDKQERALTADADVVVQVTIVNQGDKERSFELSSTVADASGRTVAAASPSAPIQYTLPAGANVTLNQTVSMSSADLWSLDSPNLYTVQTSITSSGTDVDAVETTIGVRSIHWDPNKGFFLNGQPTKIQGIANHQDFAGIGVAVPDSLQEYRVRAMKAMGANAWRTAHNPPAPALLDATDRLGFLVWDENHRNDLADNFVLDAETLVLRDRNRPSVVMWSICNEVLCENFSADNAKGVNAIYKRLDPMGGRPTTAAMNGGYGDAFQQVLDLIGINYHISEYDKQHSSNPNKPLIGSETSSDVSDRGVYKGDGHQYVSAYDGTIPGWGASAEDGWCAIGTRDFMSGSFVWTGFDYRGEPTPYAWPNVNSHFGIIDIAGFPKDNFYYYKSVWAPDVPSVHILPHWDWDAASCGGSRCQLGAAGNMTVSVWAYSSGDAVELFLNNKSLGKQNMPLVNGYKCKHVEWDVAYAPGTLVARAYKDGSVYAEDTVTTSQGPAAIGLSVDFKPGAGARDPTGGVAILARATIRDVNGNFVPRANTTVTFSVSGPADIIGMGNGDPSCREPDQPPTPTKGSRSAWNGLARVVLRTHPGASGKITLTAQDANGKLKGGSLDIKV